MEEFNISDFVQLKSGGPVMVVMGDDGIYGPIDFIRCCWADKDGLHLVERFDPLQLQKTDKFFEISLEDESVEPDIRELRKLKEEYEKESDSLRRKEITKRVCDVMDKLFLGDTGL